MSFLASWIPAFLLSPELCDCTFHGHCLHQLEYCLCDEGWTGKSDFMDASGASCHINTIGVKVIWSIFLATSLSMLIYLLPIKISGLVQSHRDQREALRIRKRRYTLLDNPVLLAVSAFYLVSLPCMVLVAVMKLGYEQTIGDDAVITLGWIFGMCGMCTGISIQRPAVLRQLLRTHSDAVPNYLDFIAAFQFQSRIVGAIYALSAFWAVPMWASHGDLTASRVGVAMLYLQLSIVFLLLALQAWRMQVFISNTLTSNALNLQGEENAAKLDALLHVREVLVQSNLKTRRMSTLLGFGFLAMCCAPPMWLLAEYVIPIVLLVPMVQFHRNVIHLHDMRFQPTRKLERVRPLSSRRRPSSGPFWLNSLDNEEEDDDDEQRGSKRLTVNTMIRVVHDPDDPLLLAAGKEEWRSLGFIQSLAALLRRPISGNGTAANIDNATPQQQIKHASTPVPKRLFAFSSSPRQLYTASKSDLGRQQAMLSDFSLTAKNNKDVNF